MKVEKFVERRETCEITRFWGPSDAEDLAALFRADSYTIDLVNMTLTLTDCRCERRMGTWILQRGAVIVLTNSYYDDKGYTPLDVIDAPQFREKWQKAEGD